MYTRTILLGKENDLSVTENEYKVMHKLCEELHLDLLKSLIEQGWNGTPVLPENVLSGEKLKQFKDELHQLVFVLVMETALAGDEDASNNG